MLRRRRCASAPCSGTQIGCVRALAVAAVARSRSAEEVFGLQLRTKWDRISVEAESWGARSLVCRGSGVGKGAEPTYRGPQAAEPGGTGVERNKLHFARPGCAAKTFNEGTAVE